MGCGRDMPQCGAMVPLSLLDWGNDRQGMLTRLASGFMCAVVSGMEHSYRLLTTIPMGRRIGHFDLDPRRLPTTVDRGKKPLCG